MKDAKLEINYPKDEAELLELCKGLENRCDLYDLEAGTGFEDRIMSGDVSGGEWVYGVSMVPCQFVTYVLRRHTCHDVGDGKGEFVCSSCGWSGGIVHPSYCPNCGTRVER
jgi:predicted RNA-binding Zn-ribbon protein involved in translation (DUF1610 family)